MLATIGTIMLRTLRLIMCAAPINESNHILIRQVKQKRFFYAARCFFEIGQTTEFARQVREQLSSCAEKSGNFPTREQIKSCEYQADSCDTTKIGDYRFE